MEYRVIEYFTDLQDKNFAYNSGDIYPRKGYKPTEERIQALLSDNNVRKRPIIKAKTAEQETEKIAETVAEAAEEAIDDDSESETEEEVEKKPRKRKKREE